VSRVMRESKRSRGSYHSPSPLQSPPHRTNAEGVCALLWLVLVGGNGQKVDRARLLEPIKVAYQELLRVGERGLVRVFWSRSVSKKEGKKVAGQDVQVLSSTESIEEGLEGRDSK
jgi:hypothetical protein